MAQNSASMGQGLSENLILLGPHLDRYAAASQSHESAGGFQQSAHNAADGKTAIADEDTSQFAATAAAKVPYSDRQCQSSGAAAAYDEPVSIDKLRPRPGQRAGGSAEHLRVQRVAARAHNQQLQLCVAHSVLLAQLPAADGSVPAMFPGDYFEFLLLSGVSKAQSVQLSGPQLLRPYVC